MRNVEFTLGPAKVFALGLFVGLSGLASFIVGGGPGWAVAVTAAGAAIAALAWPKIRLFVWNADQGGAPAALPSSAA